MCQNIIYVEQIFLGSLEGVVNHIKRLSKVECPPQKMVLWHEQNLLLSYDIVPGLITDLWFNIFAIININIKISCCFVKFGFCQYFTRSTREKSTYFEDNFYS